MLAGRHLRSALPTPLPVNLQGILGQSRSWSGGPGLGRAHGANSMAALRTHAEEQGLGGHLGSFSERSTQERGGSMHIATVGGRGVYDPCFVGAGGVRVFSLPCDPPSLYMCSTLQLASAPAWPVSLGDLPLLGALAQPVCSTHSRNLALNCGPSQGSTNHPTDLHQS